LNTTWTRFVSGDNHAKQLQAQAGGLEKARIIVARPYG
jgi:hypothetical protein